MAFKLKKDFGPKRLREVHAQLVDRLNEITPLPGLGVEVEQKPDGRQISAKEAPPGASLNNPEGGGSGGGTAAGGTFAFQLVADGGQLQIVDGKINGEFPSGMGSGNYILNVGDGSLIYAGITFAVATLEINSRFLGVSGSADYPISRVESSTGYLYWLLGFTYLDAEGAFQIQNTRVGNIDFAFTFGSNNGAPGLLPVDSGPGWLSMDSFFTT